MFFPRGGFYLGHLLDIPIYVHPSALVLLLVAFRYGQGQGLQGSIAFLIVFLTGVVLHEMGHGLTARAFGAVDLTITIWGIGGVCASRGVRHPRSELLVLIAGPAVSFLLALLSLGLWELALAYRPGIIFAPGAQNPRPTLIGNVLYFGMYLNLYWGIFNLLPIFPLDGGQFTYNLLLIVTRYDSVARAMTLATTVLCAAGFLYWQALGPDGFALSNIGLWSLLLVVMLLTIAYHHLAR